MLRGLDPSETKRYKKKRKEMSLVGQLGELHKNECNTMHPDIFLHRVALDVVWGLSLQI